MRILPSYDDRLNNSVYANRLDQFFQFFFAEGRPRLFRTWSDQIQIYLYIFLGSRAFRRIFA